MEVSIPNNSKSAVCIRPNTDAEDPLGLGIKHRTNNDFTHLGAPVGNPDFMVRTIQSRVDKMKLLLDKLPTLENSYSEFVLLSFCFALPKVSFLLSTCLPSDECLKVWKTFDALIGSSLNDILT